MAPIESALQHPLITNTLAIFFSFFRSNKKTKWEKTYGNGPQPLGHLLHDPHGKGAGKSTIHEQGEVLTVLEGLHDVRDTLLLVLGKGLFDRLGGVGWEGVDQVGECDGIVHRSHSACFVEML